MKIRDRVLLTLLNFLIPVISIGLISIVQLNKIAKPIAKDIPTNLTRLNHSSKLEGLATSIRYYDEVLTQSARNYAFTGNKKWKERYFDNVSKLDVVINLAINQGDSIDKKIFSDIDAGNINLVKMEEESLSLVDKNQKNAAVLILESKEYADQKQIYQNRLTEYNKRKGVNYEQALLGSTQTLNSLINVSQVLVNNSISIIILVVIIGVVSAFLLAIYISNSITKPIVKLRDSVRNINEKNLNQRIEIKSQDEIGELADAFNNMLKKIHLSQEDIELKIAERTTQLTKLNELMVNRELKMIELKKLLKN